jgi:hypothetical protein
LRDDWRLENRNAFANIWSDTVYGIVLFLLMCFNQSKVSIYQKMVSFLNFHCQLHIIIYVELFLRMWTHIFVLIQNGV